MSSQRVGVGDLKVGDQLKEADGGTGTVLNVLAVQQTQQMYNLTVDTAHTFYVGDNGWLVHNAGSGGCPALIGDKWSKAAVDARIAADRAYYLRLTSPNQINKAIQGGKAPPGLMRVDTPKIPGEQLHIHFSDDSALNIDGTWKHLGSSFSGLTKAQSEFLSQNGWTLPK
ncbi:polymorphic toxin-type HINT domain-containing protein [Deinococcus sp.]|uniref:polymorphic toxin-type HINT domain-containing protein n=1 Tax=Deinococcus sp. TaxID=47478 RepID=UPI003CC5AFB8